MYERCHECGDKFGIVHPHAMRPENRTIPLCPRHYDLIETVYLEGRVAQAREMYDSVTAGGGYVANKTVREDEESSEVFQPAA